MKKELKAPIKEFEQFNFDTITGIELYESMDKKVTGQYFSRNEGEASFYVAFVTTEEDFKLFIKYPDNNYFTEIHGGGFGSGRGIVTYASGENVWNPKYSSAVSYKKCYPYLCLTIQLDEFNFLSAIGAYKKQGNDIIEPVGDIANVIQIISSHRYLKLPESIRKIQYVFKFSVPDSNEINYLLVDYPAYNFQYSNHRCFFLKANNGAVTKNLQFIITDFKRARDGGSTWIKMQSIDSDNRMYEYMLFSPSKLGMAVGEVRKATLNELELDENVSPEEIDMLVETLGLALEQKEEE